MRIIARAADEASDEIYASSAEKSSKSVADCDADCAVDCLHRITRKWQWQRGSSSGGNGSICHANCVRDKSCQLNYNVCMQRKTLKRQQQQRQRRVDGHKRRLQNDLCDYRVFYHLSGSRLETGLKGASGLPATI